MLDRIRDILVGLKVPRALEAPDHTTQQLKKGEITEIEAIDGLLNEEYVTREPRLIDVALRTAKLLPIKTLVGFEFSFQTSLDREPIAAMAQLDYLRRAEVLHFLGLPGAGKLPMVTALGIAVVKAGRGAYRATLAELIAALSQAEREGRLTEKIGSMSAPRCSSSTRSAVCRSPTAGPTCSSSSSMPAMIRAR